MELPILTGASSEQDCREGIISMAFLASHKCALYLDKGILVWRKDTTTLGDQDGRLFANKVQMLRPTTSSSGMEVQGCCKPLNEPDKLVGLFEDYVQGDRRVVGCSCHEQARSGQKNACQVH